MAFRITDDEHVFQEDDADGAEVSAVDVPLERIGGVIVPALDHLLTFMTAIFPRPPCCRNSSLSMEPW